MDFKNFLVESYLTEMPIIDNSHFDKKESDTYLNKAYYNLYGFEEFDSFDYDDYKIVFVEKYNYKVIKIFILENEDVIGYVNASYDGQICFIQSVFLKEIARNKGVNTVIYRTLIDKFNILGSDESLTKTDQGGSYFIWKSLTKHVYKYDFYVYDLESKEYKKVDSFDDYNFDNDKREVFLVTKRGKDLGILNESPIFDDSNGILGKDGLNRHIFKNRLESPVIKEVEYKDMTCRLVETDAGVSAIAFKYDEYIGKVDCYHKEYFPFPNVDTAIVDINYRGLGIGKFLYIMIIDQYGGIMSGNELTGKKGSGGSFGLWQWLSKKYFFYIYNIESKTYKTVKSLEKRHVKSKNELFVASMKRII